MKYIYNVYGEFNQEDYEKQGMWTKTNTLKKIIRVFPFKLLADQTIFSIRTLRLFDNDTIVQIYTNQPEYEEFKKLKNVEIIDMREKYEEYRKLSFWCYRIR